MENPIQWNSLLAKSQLAKSQLGLISKAENITLNKANNGVDNFQKILGNALSSKGKSDLSKPLVRQSEKVDYKKNTQKVVEEKKVTESKPRAVHNDLKKVKENEKEDSEKAKVKDPKEDEMKKVAKSLSEVLNMNMQDIMALLKLLNIQPSELTQVKTEQSSDTVDSETKVTEGKTQDVVGKIADLLGLTKDQAGALKDLLGMITQELQKSQEIKVSGEMDKTNLDATEKLTDEMTSVESSLQQNGLLKNPDEIPQDKLLENPEMKKIISALMEKLTDLSVKLSQEPQKTKEEILSEIKDVFMKMQNTKVVSEVPKEQAPKEQTPKEEIGTVTDPAKVSQNHDAKNTNSKTNDKNAEEKSSNTKEPIQNSEDTSSSDVKKSFGINVGEGLKEKISSEVSASKSSDVKNESAIANLSTNQTNSTTENVRSVEKSFKTLQMPKQDIINQVVEKASVILTGDKSEMTMTLKPESLGKLQLKLVTENGIVMAKFVAESQQVKEILESNMNLLKDSLEKQGMMVQGFSVSVDSHTNEGNKNSENSKENGSREQNSTLQRSILNIADSVRESQRKNAYNMGNSQFSITA